MLDLAPLSIKRRSRLSAAPKDLQNLISAAALKDLRKTFLTNESNLFLNDTTRTNSIYPTHAAQEK